MIDILAKLKTPDQVSQQVMESNVELMPKLTSLSSAGFKDNVPVRALVGYPSDIYMDSPGFPLPEEAAKMDNILEDNGLSPNEKIRVKHVLHQLAFPWDLEGRPLKDVDLTISNVRELLVQPNLLLILRIQNQDIPIIQALFAPPDFDEISKQ